MLYFFEVTQFNREKLDVTIVRIKGVISFELFNYNEIQLQI